MSFGAILTVVIDGMHDTERLESRLVKGDRSSEIFDGYEDVVEQEFTSFVREISIQPPFAADRQASVTAIIRLGI
jgi:hypothetical protein